MTNRKWVTFHIWGKAVSSHPFLWPKGSGWCCTFCEMQSHHIHSYGQQEVSSTPHLVKSSLMITCVPMTKRQWVAFHILWRPLSWHLFLWPKGSEWHYMYILWKAVSWPCFLWPTESECHCILCKRQSHHIFCMTYSLWVPFNILWKAVWSHLSYDQQKVSDIAHFVNSTLITSFAITDSLWVTLHIVWKAVWSHLFLWPTASEWHCTCCEKQSYHIYPYDQKEVSGIAHFVKSHIFQWPKGVSGIPHFVYGSLFIYFPMTNRQWMRLHIVWKAVSSHLFLWPKGSEWHSTFCEMTNRKWLQQEVCDIAHFVKGSLITSFPTFLWTTASE